MIKLTEEELEELMIRTGTYEKDSPDSEKKKWKISYGFVEKETNKQIEESGGIEKWYEKR